MPTGSRRNELLHTWSQGLAAIGMSCKIPSPLAAESLATLGLDFVYVDQQHGAIDNPSLLSMFQAIAAGGASTMTRVPANQNHAIGLALDFGASAIMIPDVESAEEAARAVAACRFPPSGVRSFGAMRSHFVFGSSRPQDLEDVASIVMVESAAGLANVNAIAGVEGVTAIMIGPNDLGLSLGLDLTGDWLNASVLTSAIEEIRVACEDHKLVAGIGVTNGPAAVKWVERGFRMINMGNDLTYLRGGASKEIEAFRSAIKTNAS